MKKVILRACLCCTLFSCEDVEKKAGEKLQAAREAFELGNYNDCLLYTSEPSTDIGYKKKKRLAKSGKDITP